MSHGGFRCIVVTKKRLMVITALLLALIFVVIAAARTAKILKVSASQKKLPIYSTFQSEKKVSLSFDAAWGDEDTQQLIDILNEYQVKATFFVVGEWARKYPKSLKALSDAGHEIGNHSNTHKHMPKLSREDMIKDINACNDSVEKVTGKRPTLFRAPYGDYSNALIEVMAQLNMHCIQWDVDSLDWKDLSAPKIAERVNKKIGPGSIVLFHNAALHTPAALPSILKHLKDNAYSAVVLSELIYKENYTLDHEGRQHPSASSKQSAPVSETGSKAATNAATTSPGSGPADTVSTRSSVGLVASDCSESLLSDQSKHTLSTSVVSSSPSLAVSSRCAASASATSSG